MIQLTYEHKDFGNKNTLMFRIDPSIFLINKFILINKLIIDLHPDLETIKSLVFIDNVDSIILFYNAIVINRIDIFKQDIELIYMIVHHTLENLYNRFNVLDLTNAEKFLSLKINIEDNSALIRARLMEFIHICFHDIFVQHGGYVSIENIDVNNKAIYLKFLGNCIGCRYKNILLSKIQDFLIQDLCISYSLRIV